MVVRPGAGAAIVTLPAEPRSVGRARTFVCDELTALGLGAVAETAALAVSELATNAVLHAHTPFAVEVTGLPGPRVRVSVHDGSTVLPVTRATPATAAVGRGLRLVTDITDGFGAELVDDAGPFGGGKEVWFELGLAVRPAAGRTFAYAPVSADALTTPPVPAEALVEVALLNTPLQLLAREQTRHRELMREMALIAFAGDAQHEVPHALVALAGELEAYRDVGAATDAARDAAIERGEASMDLFYRVPPAVGPACTRLDDLLDAADAYCRARNLLTLAAPADGRAMRRWYLGEIARQVEGAPPVPWDGPLD